MQPYTINYSNLQNMLTTNNIKNGILMLSSVVLFACQSTTTPPNWYVTPLTNKPDFITAVGEGRSLEQAKQTALSQINAQLWTQIDSSFASRDTFQSRNDISSSSSLVDNQINSKTSQITFTGIEYPQVEHNDIAYYVQAQISRDTIIRQLQSDIEQSNLHAQYQLAQLKHQDPLLWWLNNRSLTSEGNTVAVRQAMLRALDQTQIPQASNVDSLINAIARVQSSIAIHLASSAQNKKSAELLADKLSHERLSTTFTRTANATHTLKLTSELRQSMVGEAYISTQITTLQLLGSKGNILASNEIISSGNSVSSYALSQEGAERNFAEIIDKQGLWSSLGMQ